MEIQRGGRSEQKQKLREIEVMIISAHNLKNVKHLHKMKPYAEVYVDKNVHVAKTHVDEHGGTDPTWNEVVKVNFPGGLPESDVKAALNVDIYAQGHVRDKLVGSARLLLCDALKDGDPSEPMDNPIQCTTIRVWRESGGAQGLLHLWVPPTGKFMLRRESLSFSIREETPEKEMVAPPAEKAEVTSDESDN
ncbi:uncharacterized protein LOC129304751 [Prosopis cineraria]|uniref:uncharacterized protein LOC129304751 n=1 Tax=Prosopis cineraria TaxID=364024 RepID=UPI00240F93C1|nr:uncharacterized protein LOC129304751 [Prosopis cineraria]